MKGGWGDTFRKEGRPPGRGGGRGRRLGRGAEIDQAIFSRGPRKAGRGSWEEPGEGVLNGGEGGREREEAENPEEVV